MEKIQDMFLFQNKLFVQVGGSEHANLIGYCAKTFLRGLISDEVNMMLQAIQKNSDLESIICILFKMIKA